MSNEKEISCTELMRNLKHDRDIGEKKINAHRLAYAVYCESEYTPAIKTLARVLHYDETQLKKIWLTCGNISAKSKMN